MNRRLALAVVLAAAALPVAAQRANPGPYTPTAEERASLDGKQKALAERLEKVHGATDAAVFLHTARMADRLALYQSKGHVDAVLRGLDLGLQRADALARGETPWAGKPGKSLRGFVSRIDGSVQPYGVVLPAGYDPKSKTPMRLDVVLHGRGPTEVTFLQQMEPAPNSKAAAAPEQPFIELHPFGRGNNGWRWAGETDVFEALEQVRKQYPIDPDRIVLRGFSMGGHGAWHIGVHYPGLWAAVSPGAGFSETRKYLKITGEVPAHQEKAWHIYDAVDYALNLFNAPFITYGGEKDPQLQASLNMQEAAQKEGVPLTLVVGPNTEHKYHPESLAEIMRQLATHTRNPRPAKVRFTTWTLKYNQSDWVTVDALGEHYRRAVVDADASGPRVVVKTENVAALTLAPLPNTARQVEIDGTRLPVTAGAARLARVNGKWMAAPKPSPLRKRHNLQGPIDDAFMERFLVVRGTGTPWNPATAKYQDDSIRRFQDEWRLGFRGELPVKTDREVTEADWKGANLVLFGDPASNTLLAKVAGKLPLQWTKEGVRVGARSFGAESLPVLVYPNPLNPDRYLVINSGHTFTRRDIDASNANLFPKLPDWAVLKPGGAQPEVLAADYFGESWQVPAQR